MQSEALWGILHCCFDRWRHSSPQQSCSRCRDWPSSNSTGCRWSMSRPRRFADRFRNHRPARPLRVCCGDIAIIETAVGRAVAIHAKVGDVVGLEIIRPMKIELHRIRAPSPSDARGTASISLIAGDGVGDVAAHGRPSPAVASVVVFWLKRGGRRGARRQG